MKRLLLLSLLLASSAFAADKTAYIRTDCSNNGDGTSSSCAGSPGGAGAWKTCAQAITGEVAANANLVTMGGNLILDASGTTADGSCTIDGFTTDATHLVRLIVQQANRHAGVWSTSKYRISSSGNALDIRDQYVEIDGVQAESTATGSGNTGTIYVSTSGALNLKVFNSILKFSTCNTGGGGTCAAIWWFPGAGAASLTAVNNIGYGVGTAVFYLRGNNGATSGEQLIVHNNTAYGGAYGFMFFGYGASDARYWKNNIAQNAASGDYFSADAYSTDTSATNLSKDTTAPGTSLDSKTVSFTSTTGGSEDFHLQSGDTSAKNAGTDLSGDAQYAFSTDIDGSTRSGTWDIGADEYTAVASQAVSVLNAMGEL